MDNQEDDLYKESRRQMINFKNITSPIIQMNVNVTIVLMMENMKMKSQKRLNKLNQKNKEHHIMIQILSILNKYGVVNVRRQNVSKVIVNVSLEEKNVHHIVNVQNVKIKDKKILANQEFLLQKTFGELTKKIKKKKQQ